LTLTDVSCAAHCKQSLTMQCLYYYLPKVTEGLSTVVCRTDNTTLHECEGQ